MWVQSYSTQKDRARCSERKFCFLKYSPVDGYGKKLVELIQCLCAVRPSLAPVNRINSRRRRPRRYLHAQRWPWHPTCYYLSIPRVHHTGWQYPWPQHHMRPPSPSTRRRRQTDLIKLPGAVRREPGYGREGQLTVDAGLELLAADLTGEVTQAQLLVEFDDDRVLVVAEETGECGCEGFPLYLVS